jgi:hypothetical protein
VLASQPTKGRGGQMVKRSAALLVLFLALGSSAICAPDALAGNHTHLISFRPCNGVLVAADFDDDLEEVSSPTLTHQPDFVADTSSCKYAALTEGDASSLMKFTNGGLGGECLDNILRLASEEKTPPPGGCYRIVSTSLIVVTGSRARKLLPKLRKGAKDPAWPSDYARHIAHGIGNRAEFGYDDENKGFAYLQVLNATLTVETNGNISLLHVLRLGAAAL